MCRIADYLMSRVREFDVEEFVWFKMTVVLAGVLLGVHCAGRLKRVIGAVWVLFMIFGGLLAYSLLPKNPRVGEE